MGESKKPNLYHVIDTVLMTRIFKLPETLRDYIFELVVRRFNVRFIYFMNYISKDLEAFVIGKKPYIMKFINPIHFTLDLQKRILKYDHTLINHFYPNVDKELIWYGVSCISEYMNFKSHNEFYYACRTLKILGYERFLIYQGTCPTLFDIQKAIIKGNPFLIRKYKNATPELKQFALTLNSQVAQFL